MNMRLTGLVTTLALALSIAAFADPPNTQRLDGRPTEYDGVDLRDTIIGSNTWAAAGTITNLFVTWDATYLYIALQGWETGNKLAVLMDVDPGNGTGATTTTNWTGTGQDYVRYNDMGWRKSDDIAAAEFGLDYVFATEGFYHDILRVLYDGAALDTNAVIQVAGLSGPTPHGTATDIVALEGTTACDLKGMELRIPWAELYGTNRFGTVQPGEVVPQGATLRLLAGIHNNDPNSAYSSPDTIPNQVSPYAVYVDGILTSDTYLDVVVDADNDGFPDLASGDLNAPYLVSLQGLAGKRVLYAMFNETVTTDTTEVASNWLIGSATPSSVEQVQDNAVLMTLTNDLPGTETQVTVTSTGIEDIYTNSKTSYLCFFPTSGGIETAVTVRFYLETSSGLGINPGASNFFVNGSAAPLEWGYPPPTSSKLILDSGTRYYRDVTFPPSTPLDVYYKYSGQLTSTGTNNYEAVRLHKFADAARVLTLNTLGQSMSVTDHLGVAAHPWRDPAATNSSGYNAVYADAQRGDAGVRQRTTMLFQLDLSGRDTKGVTRVLLLGTDPLRGFNLNNESPAISDYPTAPTMTWNTGGLTLNDSGANGDLVAGDGIYSRSWAFSTDGLDSLMVPGFPSSLVGGEEFDSPYFGTDYWAARRSPRSFAYKFAVYKSGSGQSFESPSSDIEYYIQSSATNIVLPPFVWDNSGLPLPPPSNAPALVDIEITGSSATVIFTNVASEAQHGVQVSTNLAAEWLDFGQRAATNLLNEWVAAVPRVATPEMYRAFAGPPKPYKGVWWDPNPVPAGGGVTRIYFTQHSRALAGNRSVQIAGSFNGWTPSPMVFMGDGTWYYDLTVNVGDPDNIEFKVRDLSGGTWLGMGGDEAWRPNYLAYKGTLRATWTPVAPTNGELFAITYDATGSALATATSVYARVGFDENWDDLLERQMTNTGGTVWDLAFPVPTNRSLSVNFVFNGYVPPGGGQVWDSESSTPQGRQWRVFIAEPEE